MHGQTRTIKASQYTKRAEDITLMIGTHTTDKEN